MGVLNDLTDRADDLAAGKRNRTVGRPGWQIGLVIGVCLIAGLAWLFAWRDRPMLFAVYLAAWIVYSMYSIPPVRLKARGFAGAACDALGAHLLPILAGILLTFDRLSMVADRRWIIVVAVWSAAYGLRNIVWHQLSDRAFDERAGVSTFAVRNERLAERLILLVVFPIELAALAAVLWRLHLAIAVIALAAYLLFVALRWILLGTGVHVIRERRPGCFALQGYYDFLFPASLLIASALMHRSDLLMLLIHFVVFPKQPRQGARLFRRLVTAMQSPSFVTALRQRTRS